MNSTMQNVTLSADANDINVVRQAATSKGSSLNKEFRRWLRQEAQANSEERVKAFRKTMERLSYVKTDRKYTREEMNER
jgi:hypothetical protein